MFLVDAAHEGSRGRQNLIHEDEDGFFGRELDPLADYINKLPDGQIGWNQVLLLVDGGDIALLNLFANYLCRQIKSVRY